MYLFLLSKDYDTHNVLVGTDTSLIRPKRKHAYLLWFFSSAWRKLRGITTRQIARSRGVRIQIMSGHSQTRWHRRVRVAQSRAFSWKSIAGDTKSRGICGILSKGTRIVPQKSSLKLFLGKCAPVAQLVDDWVTLKPSLRVEEMYWWYPYIRFFQFSHFHIVLFMIFWKLSKISAKIVKWLVLTL